MYSVYNKDTREELYRISSINTDNFNNTLTVYSEKIIDGKIVKESKTINIAYRII